MYIMKKVDTVKKILDKGVDGTLALMLAVMTVVVFSQVFFRYVLRSPLSWPEETARVLVVWLSFLGGYMALREKRHIGFNLLVKKLPRRGKFVVEVIVFLLILVFLGVVVYQGTFFAYRSLNIRMPYTRISVGWLVYSVFPITGALMFVQTVLDLLALIAAFRTGDVIETSIQEDI